MNKNIYEKLLSKLKKIEKKLIRINQAWCYLVETF
jgi:hypothetical protein